MNEQVNLAVSAVNVITAVGHNALMTADAVFTGVSGIAYDDSDGHGDRKSVV
jgi:hypothetical protein